jgi:hypothetical protein
VKMETASISEMSIIFTGITAIFRLAAMWSSSPSASDYFS